MLAIAFDAPRLIARLDAQLKSVLHRYRVFSHTGLLSITLAVPELASLQLTELSKGSIYWARSDDQVFRFARGQAVTIETQGENRLIELEQRFNALSQYWIQLNPDGLEPKVQAFVGFAFSPNEKMASCWRGFANACIHVPSILLERKGLTSSLTFTCHTQSGKGIDDIRSEWLRQTVNLFVGVTNFKPSFGSNGPMNRISDIPSNDQWLAQVNKVINHIEEGFLEKVVLTRRVRIASDRPLQAARSLAWLASRHTGGVQFAYTTTHATLIGASPERLVSLRGDKVVCDAIAGTACRHPHSEFDYQLGLGLLADNKARHEQSLVVDSILRSLEPMCISLNAPVEPQLLKSSGVQHLWSTIHGRVNQGVSLLNLASRLHPTPAVGGEPYHRALAWLETHEKGQRGWYTGALGWLANDGSGELTVILRCALLRNNIADLFAGAGIVGNSDPQSELDETEWKLRTMLDALTVV